MTVDGAQGMTSFMTSYIATTVRSVTVPHTVASLLMSSQFDTLAANENYAACSQMDNTRINEQ